MENRVTKGQFDRPDIIERNQKQKEYIKSLVYEIAAVKEGRAPESLIRETYHMLNAYASTDHVKLLEGVLEDLKSEQPVNDLLKVIGRRIRASFFEE